MNSTIKVSMAWSKNKRKFLILIVALKLDISLYFIDIGETKDLSKFVNFP